MVWGGAPGPWGAPPTIKTWPEYPEIGYSPHPDLRWGTPSTPDLRWGTPPTPDLRWGTPPHHPHLDRYSPPEMLTDRHL